MTRRKTGLIAREVLLLCSVIGRLRHIVCLARDRMLLRRVERRRRRTCSSSSVDVRWLVVVVFHERCSRWRHIRGGTSIMERHFWTLMMVVSVLLHRHRFFRRRWNFCFLRYWRRRRPIRMQRLSLLFIPSSSSSSGGRATTKLILCFGWIHLLRSLLSLHFMFLQILLDETLFMPKEDDAADERDEPSNTCYPGKRCGGLGTVALFIYRTGK